MNEAAGAVMLTITANRFGDPNVPISVSYTTRDGSATAGQDYSSPTPPNNTVTFGPGETQKQIAIQITNDNLIENAENFFVDLSNPSNASITATGATATVTIADDDSGTSTIQFSSATYSVNEGAGSIALTVVRSGGVQLAASANYNTTDGTASSGSDYTPASGAVSFAPGETQKTIIVAITDDSTVEGDENFSVTLSNPSTGAALGNPNAASVTIMDNDGGGNIVQFNPIAYNEKRLQETALSPSQ